MQPGWGCYFHCMDYSILPIFYSEKHWISSLVFSHLTQEVEEKSNTFPFVKVLGACQRGDWRPVRSSQKFGDEQSPATGKILFPSEPWSHDFCSVPPSDQRCNQGHGREEIWWSHETERPVRKRLDTSRYRTHICWNKSQNSSYFPIQNLNFNLLLFLENKL